MRRRLGSAMIWPWRRSPAGRSRRSTFPSTPTTRYTRSRVVSPPDTTVPLSPAPRCSPISPRPVAAAWGRAWVVGGGYEVWFQGPVLADERVVVAGGSDKVVASVGERSARLVPERPLRRRRRRVEASGAACRRTRRSLGRLCRPPARSRLYAEQQLVHPVVWPSLANRVFATQPSTAHGCTRAACSAPRCRFPR